MTIFPILISGTPSTGKTSLRRFLEKQGVKVLSLANENEDDFTLEKAGLRNEWNAFYSGESQAFIEAVLFQKLILEWGFPAHCFSTVQRIHKAGIPTWWIDGNHAVVRTNHEKAGKNVQKFDKQVADVSARWPEFEKFYSGRIVQRVNSEGVYMPPEEVCRLIFGGHE